MDFSWTEEQEIWRRIYNFIDMDFGKGKITGRTATGKNIHSLFSYNFIHTADIQMT